MVVQIISGFRGSGKTTFLNQCIGHVTGKVAVIQNDFGAEAVDLENFGDRLIYEEISEGCICCGMALEFEEKMRRIATEECPDRIFIEASGFGKLSDVVKACLQLKGQEHLDMTIGPNVTVVDVPMVEAYASGLGEFYTDQIEGADAILVNNIDPDDVEPEEIEEGWKVLERLNPEGLKIDDVQKALESVLNSEEADKNQKDLPEQKQTDSNQSVYRNVEIGKKEENVPVKEKLKQGMNKDFQMTGDILTKYLGTEAIVEVPEGIQIIGDSAFEYCMEVQEVYLPDTVEQIGKHAFQGSGIRKIHLPEGLRVIDIYAFSGTPLEYVELPEILQKLGHSAFRYCRMMKKAEFPTHLVEIPHDTFNDCGKLREVTLPKNVEVIGAHAFSGCAALEEMELPESVKRIEEGAFVTCVSLEKIYLPDGLEAVERKVFYRCTNLKELYFPKHVTQFGKGIFSQCSALKRVHIEGNPVDEEVFQDWDMWTTCYDMEEIIAPNMKITRFAKEWRMWAAAGLADYLTEQGDVRSDVLDSYIEDLKENRSAYETVLLENKKLLQFFICYRLLTGQAVNRLLNQSMKKSDMEIRSMLLNYQDEIRDEDKKEETGSQLDQLLAALS